LTFQQLCCVRIIGWTMIFGYGAITFVESKKVMREQGFSLIELLMAVVIVAILTAIAFPSYQSYLRKGTRAAAQGLLLDIANRQTQYLLDARNYAVGPTALATLNIALPADVATFYSVAVENGAGGTAPTSPPTFLIKATPIVGSRQEADGELRLANDGGKWRAGNPGW
jgi:type IV pilus assembly protein PilE